MNIIRNACIAIPFAAAILGFSIPSSAQDSGLVNVDLRNADILSNIANHLNVSVNNVPITVQVPAVVAANVCDVSVDVLTKALKKGGASCYAQGTTAAFNKAVQNVMNLQH